MAALDQISLENELKKKQICRFCLSQDPELLANIFLRCTSIKSSASLPIQVMAIASIEVFNDDGMPSYICFDCISMFEHSYQFKQMCKKADTLLRQYPLVGKWPKSLEKPTLHTVSVVKQNAITAQKCVEQSKQNLTQEALLLPKKMLNVDAADKDNTNNNITIGKQCVNKIEKVDNECSITYLEKIDNNDELSFDDVQLLVASEDVTEAESIKMDDLPVIDINDGNKSTKQNLLNKSSLRILNKCASPKNEHCLSVPKIMKRDDGSVEIVAEILSIDNKYEEERDPNNAELIETNIFPCSYCERTFPLVQLRDLHLKNHIRDRNFQCDECDKSFFSKHDLQRHLLVHNGEKPFKCSACDKRFVRASRLTEHIKTHTDIPKYICVHCERPFISKEDMQKHAERHTIYRPFHCKICNKGFVFKQGLERHKVIHSRQQPFPCHYCDQSFPNTTKLTRHLTAHAGVRPYPCKYCKKSYLLLHHLTRHLRSHRNIIDNINAVDFMCTTCKTSFESFDKLIEHSKIHANEQNLDCPLCKEKFNNMNELTTHIHDHSEGEAYACEFCDLFFMTAEKLQLHTDFDHTQEMEAYHADDRAQADKKKTNSAKKEIDVSNENLQSTVNNAFLMDTFLEDGSVLNNQLKTKIKSEQKETSPKIKTDVTGKKGGTAQCKLCNKSFASKYGLERHEPMHSRQHPCQYCDQRFTDTIKLARHLRSHTGLRAYPCKFCKKSYLYSHHLKRHLRSHTNINDNMNAVGFMCPICKTTFESRDKLIQHSKTHANEQNLVCPLCNETFDNMNILTTHIQDHSKGKSYSCEVCDLIFMTTEKLQLHTDRDHVQKMEAYHAEDDRAQTDKVKEEIDIGEEKLQSSVNACGNDLNNQLKREIKSEQDILTKSAVNVFIVDEFLCDENDLNSQLRRQIKIEKEASPKIIDQIVFQSGTEQTTNDEVENQVDDNNSPFLPLKQRIITTKVKLDQQNSWQKEISIKVEKDLTP